ncbi:hypothetical protein TD95_000620 [Thielaviopsis punctulata]|uniref:Uncharacterized protein n=1 Tax=Thielaviopsis punctulata TaxID=72032 RepID=A0A0F4ZJQ5_9PEZI|nr:hypothetical protein TD95_000620 [Thielaviopsis punctulata]
MSVSKSATATTPAPAFSCASPTSPNFDLKSISLPHDPDLDIKTPKSPALQSAATSLAISRSLSDASISTAAEQAAVANAAIHMSRQSHSFKSFNVSQSTPATNPSALALLSPYGDDIAPDMQTEPFPTTDGAMDMDPKDPGQTTTTTKRSKRRGYMRPQGTDFAASARHRESVLSLGSIAHIQYYFARTGLLDGKGAQLARKNKNKRATLDLSKHVQPLRSPSLVAIDSDGAKTRHLSLMFGGGGSNGGDKQILLESPMQDGYFDSKYTIKSSPGATPKSPSESSESDTSASATTDDDDTSAVYSDEDEDEDEDDVGMLPPTTSTFRAAEKHIEPPPSISELKRDLRNALSAATTALEDVLAHKTGGSPRKNSVTSTTSARVDTQSWFEVQGMHILDVMTMAIRAAKMYYTAHENPERLDSIKPEREVRSELLSVMECLRQMATRDFKGGIKEAELGALAAWIAGASAILRRDEQIEAEERNERRNWSWLQGDWTGREVERELAFLASMHPEAAAALPAYTPLPDDLSTLTLPTPFLAAFQDGLVLVKFHNAAVRKSKRRFGAIASFHKNTQKPYRAADNIRYWAKAAELRWETPIKVDALAVVYNAEPEAWRQFHDAIFAWCRSVREEIAAELQAEIANKR